MKMHPSITMERLVEMAEENIFHSLSDPGLCIECGEEQLGVEPDAQRYTCEGCGEPAVYGLSDLLIRICP